MLVESRLVASPGERLRGNAVVRLLVMGSLLIAWFAWFGSVRALGIAALGEAGPPETMIGAAARLFGAALYVAGGLVL
jgi:hypothetical protein